MIIINITTVIIIKIMLIMIKNVTKNGGSNNYKQPISTK